MQISQQHGSVYCDRLANRGVIEPDRCGHVKFTVPFSREYLQTKMNHCLTHNIDPEVDSAAGRHVCGEDEQLPEKTPRTLKE